MERISTRDDVLEFIRINCTHSAVRRAMDDGKYELLGAFVSLPPHTKPGWIVKVTSKHGKVWPVAVAAGQHSYEVFILDTIPWSLWDGEMTDNLLYFGDHPYIAIRKKRLARTQI